MGIERRIGYHVKACSKIFCLSGNPPLAVTVPTGERDGIFVVSSFTGTRENQYSDEAHFHLDGKVKSKLQTSVTWKARCGSKVVARCVLLSQEQKLVLEQ